MTAYLVRAELRRRARSVVLLSLLVALVVGTVLTAAAGARRTRTAFDRYLDMAQLPDVGVVADDPAVVADLLQSPIVEFASVGRLFAIFPRDVEGGFYPMLSFVDGSVPTRYFRAPHVEGRAADPSDPHEVTVSERMSADLGLRPGDVLPMASFSVERATAVFDPAASTEPDGPVVELEVVGIVRDAVDITGREEDLAVTFLTPAFAERYEDEIGDIGGFTLVDLVDGATSSQLADELGRLLGPEVELDASIGRDAVRAQGDPIVASLATGLWAFGAVAGVAGVVAIGQTIARMAASSAMDDPVLAAVGCTRAARAARVLAPGAVAVAIGTIVGAVGSVLASPLHPIGLARRAEIDPGVDVDLLVLGVGATAAVVLGAGCVVVGGWRATRQPRRSLRRERVAERAAAAGFPAPVVTGLHLATSRGAVAAAAAGCVGVLAAMVFAASADRLVHSPRLYGWGWDAVVAGSDTTHIDGRGFDESSLLADDDLAAVADVVFALSVRVDGEPIQVMVVNELRGQTEPVVVSGRAPTGEDEIALAGRTLERVGARVGDTVEVATANGRSRLRVVGVIAVPVTTDGGLAAEGGALSSGAAAAVGFPGSCDGDASCYRNYALTLRPDVDVETIDERYSSELVAVDVPIPPGEVQQLQAVDRLPWVLAAFLALLGAVAMGHAAWSTTARRRRDLAVLRTLGFTGSQLRTTVAVQVGALSLAGVALGVLGGAVAGRQVWRLVAGRLALPSAPLVPMAGVAAVVLGTLLLAQAIATVPRRIAARVPAADVLRAE